jgi:ribonuclease HII
VPARALVDGDGRSAAIAAASIVAKVTRDRLMARLGAAFPGYGFERHKGYATPEHRAALQALGPCVHHRRSFAPVREALARAGAARTGPPAQGAHRGSDAPQSR